LLPADMGIELECNSQGFRRSNAQRRRRNLLQLQMLKPTSNAQRRRRRNHLQLQMLKPQVKQFARKKKMNNKLHQEEEQICNYKKKERKKMVQCAKKKKSAIAMVETKEQCR
jgi:tRNA U34 2-thiouridine synthase MnmA/TrmU